MSQATKEQENMIQATEGFIRCGAVPGAGKTFCIVHRIAYLIQKLYVDSASIVALTFTNKAAASMTRRLKQLIGDEANCFCGTFHGYCNKILKEDIHHLAYPATFTILDKRDQINLIREIAAEQEISLQEHTAKKLLEHVMKQKVNGDYVGLITGKKSQPLENYIASAKKPEDIVFYHYLQRQWKCYALDFEDIMNFALHIFQTHKDVLEKWQNRCQ